MIAGALEIICGVDACVVNPLLLPAAQGEEKYAYIVITYNDHPDVFDILFVHGSRVAEYVCIHRELRVVLPEKSVELYLSACGMRCRVYLFSVTRQCFERFQSTFHCAQSLNVVIDRLSRKQLSSLLTETGCRNGILEIRRAARPFPVIDLASFDSVEELLREALRFRQGRMILYDLELNSSIRERSEILIGSASTGCSKPGIPDSGANTIEAEGGKRDFAAEAPVGDPAPVAAKEEPAPAAAGDPDIVELFRNVLQEFMRAVDQEYGTRLDKRMNVVFSRLFPRPLGFDPGLVNRTNMTNVLSLIEEGVKRSWRYSRKNLRKSALEIVKAFYDTNYELLRIYGVEERVGKCYRELHS